MDDPANLARRCRIEAMRATHPTTKDFLLELAAEYEALAGDAVAQDPDDPDLQNAVADRLASLASKRRAWGREGMKDGSAVPDSAAPPDVEREIRDARTFTPQEALARMAGPGAMKGASPIAREQQAEMAIGSWLRSHVVDPSGALNKVLHRHLKGSSPLLHNPDQPLVVLASYCDRLLASDQLLAELVREADVEWGKAMGERPHFEKAGSLPHAEDPYTLASVRSALADAVKQLPRDAPSTNEGNP
jgi:hypothetical protein